jgi:hypothetical protein
MQPDAGQMTGVGGAGVGPPLQDAPGIVDVEHLVRGRNLRQQMFAAALDGVQKLGRVPGFQRGQVGAPAQVMHEHDRLLPQVRPHARLTAP